jgi:chlorite dismutase
MQPADLNMTTEVTGHQLFLFVTLGDGRADGGLVEALDLLGRGMENVHDADGPPSDEAFARGRFQLLRAEAGMSSEQQIVHSAVSGADGLVRLECASLEPIRGYEIGLRAVIEPRGGSVETLAGVMRPRSYTSHAMAQFAYAHAMPPGPGDKYPLAAVTPMNKTDAWWQMDFLHRESFFLPRYDENENMVVKGHALASAAGVPGINRRLVHAPDGYGLEGDYDFVGYFEFAEADAPVFREVMAGLRDTEQNPEWKYVLEGPEWWGRRVRSASEFLAKG